MIAKFILWEDIVLEDICSGGSDVGTVFSSYTGERIMSSRISVLEAVVARDCSDTGIPT